MQVTTGDLDDIWQLEEYASKKFKSQKKGAFGSKIPTRELIQWQKGALKRGLLDQTTKEGPTLFRLIQSYMGDRPHKEKEDITLVRDLLDIALNKDAKKETRDELYCQVLKQLTNNPSPASVFKGWDLLCICFQYFPPSEALEPYLHKWLHARQASSDDKIPDYSKFCLRKLPKIMAEGSRGRVPDVKELKGLVDAPFKQPVFGVTLEEIMEAQKAIDEKANLPLVLTVLSKAVIDLKGHETEGIFRVPGDTAFVTNLKIQIENGDYSCKGVDDPHTPGSLLKLWMRELSDPIIPCEFYDDAIAAAKADDEKMAVALVGKMPKLNKQVIFYVIEYLREVAQPDNVPKTKMNINNLAMVFAPNFLRCPSEDPSVIFNTQKFQQTYVKHLITSLTKEDLKEAD